MQGKITFLLQSEDPLLQELYSKIKGQCLSPKTIVTYDREAFLYSSGNVRLTLGRNLHSGLRSLDFLAPGVVMHRYPKARLWWRSNMMTSCRIWFAWRFRSAAERPGLIPNMPSAGAMIRMTFQVIFKSAFLENVTVIPVFDMVLAMACAFAVRLYIFSSISAAMLA